VGALSPTWSAVDHLGQRHGRGDGWQALVFYPGDDTPGCTAQLQDIQAHLADLEAAGVQPLGVNPASAESHARFASRYGFTFPILVDEGAAVARPFGARMRGLGRTIRTVYLLDPGGRVVFVERGAPPATALVAAAAR
jgi:peroxiredoxin Q/BCP